jgi:cell division protein FtsQ
MTIRPAARSTAQVRRRGTRVRRRSAGLSPVRAAALLAMVGAALAVYGLASSPVFGLERLVIHGAAITPEQTIRDTVGVEAGSNLVSLDTAALERRLGSIPTIRRATVSAGLPGILSVSVEERRPILVWATATHRFLIDIDGHAIAELGADEAIPQVDESGHPLPPGSTTGQDLPVIHDDRPTGGPTRVGDTVDALDLDVSRRLGALRPSDVDSTATTLVVHLHPELGFIVRPTGGGSAGWTAVFGFYTTSDDVRSPVLVPDQVRLLRSLLSGREATVGLVRLASATDGTYVPRPSPSPSPSPSAAP